MPDTWMPLKSRPQHISVISVFCRLFFNRNWNEALFMVSCAERLIEEDNEHSRDQIFARIQPLVGAEQIFRFRLVFVSRNGASLRREVLYMSPAEGGLARS